VTTDRQWREFLRHRATESNLLPLLLIIISLHLWANHIASKAAFSSEAFTDPHIIYIFQNSNFLLRLYRLFLFTEYIGIICCKGCLSRDWEKRSSKMTCSTRTIDDVQRIASHFSTARLGGRCWTRTFLWHGISQSDRSKKLNH
jgi:hypothetical protein